MAFVCLRCGCCCRALKLNAVYHELDRGDGVCRHLDEEKNECLIYAERPLVCRVDKAYSAFFSAQLTVQAYYDLNYAECRALREAQSRRV